jgi:hypothetical protein
MINSHASTCNLYPGGAPGRGGTLATAYEAQIGGAYPTNGEPGSNSPEFYPTN